MKEPDPKDPLANLARIAGHLQTVDNVSNLSMDRADMLYNMAAGLLGEDSTALAILWLADRNGRQLTLTAWTHETYPAKRLIPEKMTYRLSVSLESYDNPSGYIEDTLKKKLNLDPRTEFGQRLISLGNMLPEQPVNSEILALNHFDRENGREFIGFVQILHCNAPIVWSAPVRQILSQMVAARIYIGRRQRIDAATQEFLESSSNVSNEEELFILICRVLQKYLHNDRCSIYKPDGHDKLLRVADSRNSPETHIPYAGLIGFVHDHPIGDDESGYCIRLNDIQNDEHREITIGKPIALAEADIRNCANGNGEPMAALLIQAVPVNGVSRVPLATIKMLATPGPGFPGGTFSSTDETICRRLCLAFTQIAPGIIISERIKATIGRFSHFDNDAVEVGDDHELIGQIYSPFVSALIDLIPIIDEAWIIYRRSDDAIHWIDETGKSEVNKFQLDEFELAKLADRRSTMKVDDLTLTFIFSSTTVFYALAWKTPRIQLASHDEIIIRQIAADTRQRVLGRLDVDGLLRQIANLRHAVKSTYTGVVTAVAVIKDNIDEAKEVYPRMEGHDVLRSAELNKAVRNLQLSCNQGQRFIENARIASVALRRKELKFNAIDLSSIVKIAYTDLNSMFEKRLLRWSFDNKYGNARPAIADRDAMYIVISNLIENAAKYSRSNTMVKSILSVQWPNWIFSITNYGPYIPPEYHELIFEQLTRLEPGRGEQMPTGTGLGLPAVKHIVMIHDPDGGVSVRSELLDPGDDGRATQARTTFRVQMKIEAQNLNG